MNYIKHLLFGEKINLDNTLNKDKMLEKYSIEYCQYKYTNSGMSHPIYGGGGDMYLNQFKIEAVERSEPHYKSTFPDFNEKILNIVDYEKYIKELEQKYTSSAFDSNKVIKITKKITPFFFNHNNKNYNLSNYEFIITIK